MGLDMNFIPYRVMAGRLVARCCGGAPLGAAIFVEVGVLSQRRRYLRTNLDIYDQRACLISNGGALLLSLPGEP